MPNCIRRKLFISGLLKCAKTKLSGQTKRRVPRKFRNPSLIVREYQHVSGIIIMIIKRNSNHFIIESSHYWNPLWAWRVLIKSLWWGEGWWVVGGGYSYSAVQYCLSWYRGGESNISITIKQQQRLDLLKHYSWIARWGKETVALAGLAWYLDLEKLSLSFWPQLSID